MIYMILRNDVIALEEFFGKSLDERKSSFNNRPLANVLRTRLESEYEKAEKAGQKKHGKIGRYRFLHVAATITPLAPCLDSHGAFRERHSPLNTAL